MEQLKAQAKLSRYGVLAGTRTRLIAALADIRYASIGLRMTPERQSEYQQVQTILNQWIEQIEIEQERIVTHLTPHAADSPDGQKGGAK